MNGPHVITADHIEGDMFVLRMRGHEIVVDQPTADGGQDTGPSPTEVFVAGLAGCVGFYAHRYLARHHLPDDGLAVEVSYAMSAGRPARVESIDVRIHVPGQVPAERLPALLAVASACTVHNTLQRPPRIDVGLAVPVAHAGGVS
jgi:putative redox protein